MTTFFTLTLQCPNCQRSFKSQAVGSTNTFGGKTTDLRTIAGGAQPTSGFIHSCPDCGFSGDSGSFSGSVEPEVSKMIEERITKIMAEEAPHAGRSFEFAAWIAECRKEPFHVLGDLYHRAAWCCQDAGQDSEEEYFRRRAADAFTKSLQKGEMPSQQVPVYTYLIGELYRRAGDAGAASEWFEKAEQQAKQSGDARLQELAKQQRENPQEML